MTDPSADVTVGDASEQIDEAGNGDRPSSQPAEHGSRGADRRVERLALAITLAPFAVGALTLLFAVGGDYSPFSDHALTELQTRSVGRDEVLVGLYSRDDWNHPGPALFYLLAPFYWLTGGMSVGINLGALAINGAAVAGMALVARRLGGTRLMLVTVLASALLMRMLSAEFLHDPWNCYVTALPYGLLILLSWAMWRGETWAFPVGALVTTFLAQSHVGFLPLAAPLLGWGAVGLVASVAGTRDGAARAAGWRRLLRVGVVGAGVLVVGWLPVAVDAGRNRPSNAREIYRYFRDPGEAARTLGDGWSIMTGQLGGLPEWLTYKHDLAWGGQSPFVSGGSLPWLLVLVVAAGVVLWRRDVAGTRSLLATLGLTYVVGVVAVSRTVGLAFDYRLRWTYLPAMLAFVVVGWAGWTVAAERWPRAGGRVLTGATLAGLTVLAGVNVVTAATAGTPQDDDSAAVASLTAQVLDELPDDPGTVLVDDAHHSGAWHARGLVLGLERRGLDVVVDEDRADEYGRHRVVGDTDDVDVRLVVTRDEFVDMVAERPGVRSIAEWYAIPADEAAPLVAERAQMEGDVAAGRLTADERSEREEEIARVLGNDGDSMSWQAAVFVDEGGDEPATGGPATGGPATDEPAAGSAEADTG